MQPREVLQQRKPLVLEKEMLQEDPLPQSVVHPSVVLLAEKPTRESLPEQPREDPLKLREVLQQEKAGELAEEAAHLREELLAENLHAELAESPEEALEEDLHAECLR